MSTTTLKLPFKRYIAQVSTGAPRSKSTYLALMAENLEALKACPWREAAGGPASLTGHDFTAKTQFSDAYDAFKLTGNYDTAAMTEIAYAGMAAYRFTVPAAAISGGVSITGVSLPISRDRFEAAGVHIAVALSNSAYPSDDWSVVRGSGALAASSLLTQTAAHLTAGSPASGTADIDLSDVSSSNPPTYLWVYVTLEDYTSHWTMYNAKEQRLYAIEGSAMLVGDSAEVTFDGVVTADSESDAGVKHLSKPIPVRVTHYEGYHRTLRPKICFTALSIVSSYEPVTSEKPFPVKSILLPVATWTIPAGTGELPLDHMLATDGLRIPEGDYIIEAWIDETGDGKFAPGEPYGCTQKIHLTAYTNPERMDIELTEVHPGMPRMDLSAMIAGIPPPSTLPETQEGETPEPHPVSDATFATLAAATDRGRWNLQWATIGRMTFPSTDAPPAASRLTRVRIFRARINEGQGISGGESTSNTVLVDRYFELSVRSTLTEADLLADGMYDLDWLTILPAYGASAATLDTATYYIVIGDGEVVANNIPDIILPVCFHSVFESLSRQSPTVHDPAFADAVYAGRPTFRWTHPNTIGKDYPAFECFITTSNVPTEHYAIDSSTIVWRSGALRAPTRDADGNYEYTAPIQAGTTVELDGGGTFTFQPNTTYYWAVSMLDAKYTSINVASESLTPFTFAVPAN